MNVSNVPLILSISCKVRSPKRCYFGLKTVYINLTSGLGFPGVSFIACCSCRKLYKAFPKKNPGHSLSKEGLFLYFLIHHIVSCYHIFLCVIYFWCFLTALSLRISTLEHNPLGSDIFMPLSLSPLYVSSR